jgi:hypothetical protein
MPRRRSTRGIVPDSEDGAEIEVLESPDPSVFEDLITTSNKISRRTSARHTRGSVSSAPSGDISTRGPSPDYETPATSAAVTPVESFSRTRRSMGAAVEFKLGGSSINASSKRKRASAVSSLRESTVVDTSKDEEIALQLQEDEYREPATKKSRPSPQTTRSGGGRGRSQRVALVPESDDEEDNFETELSALSELSSIESSDDDVPLKQRTTQARRSAVKRGKGKPATSTIDMARSDFVLQRQQPSSLHLHIPLSMIVTLLSQVYLSMMNLTIQMAWRMMYRLAGSQLARAMCAVAFVTVSIARKDAVLSSSNRTQKLQPCGMISRQCLSSLQ